MILIGGLVLDDVDWPLTVPNARLLEVNTNMTKNKTKIFAFNDFIPSRIGKPLM